MEGVPIFHNFNSIIPADVCDIIVREGEGLQHKKGTVYGDEDFKVLESVRDTNVSFWNEWHWINGIMTHYIAMANREYWQMDVLASEGVQYGVYDKKGFYDWHIDEYVEPISGDQFKLPDIRVNRKISATLNLSNPDSYEGGDLQFKDHQGNQIEVPLGHEQGSIIVFPSNIYHTVKPVTKGVRRSCVSWIVGIA